MKFYETSSDTTGTTIIFDNQECEKKYPDRLSLDYVAPFINEPVIPAYMQLTAPAFTTNTEVTVTTDILEYLYSTDWYYILNEQDYPSFIEALWSLENLDSYYRFNISSPDGHYEIQHSSNLIYCETNSTRTDVITMEFTKLSDSTTTT